MNLNELPKVPLDPELVLVPGPLGMMIDHPLVKEIMYYEPFNYSYNEQLRLKKEKTAEALTKKDWHGFIWWHERPYRLNAFLKVMNQMSHEQYWETLREVWTDSENIWQNQSTWEELLLAPIKGQEYFMTAEERAYLASLPEVLTIHRGYNKSPRGFSYSLSKTKARWFANRFNQQGKIKTIRVKKSEVFAYVDSRNEKEIIYLTT